MKEAKPILLIKLNSDVDFGNTFGEMQSIMEKKFFDYHVLCLQSDIDNSIELQVFNDDSATETSTEELKQLIINEVNRNKP